MKQILFIIFFCSSVIQGHTKFDSYYKFLNIIIIMRLTAKVITFAFYKFLMYSLIKLIDCFTFVALPLNYDANVDQGQHHKK